MKGRRTLCLLLTLIMLLSLAACSGRTNIDAPSTSKQTDAPGETGKGTISSVDLLDGKIPASEYERGIWYGFLPDELADADPDTTVVTWKQYCAMLGKMISAYDESKLPEWEKMTADAPDAKMKRDGAVVSLYFAGKMMDILYFNGNFDWDEEFSNYDWVAHASWDYPVFDWEQSAYIDDAWQDGNNSVGVAVGYMIYRQSCITGLSLLNIDGDGWNADDDLTLHDALVSAVRLYESVEEIACESAEKLFAAVMETEAAQELAAETDARKQEVLNSQTTIIKSDEYVQGETYTGTAYYVSNKGDDNNDGLSPETPFATLERLNEVQFSFGDAVFFERGSLWRKAQLPRSIVETEGVTLSAYSEGEKPKFYASPENGSGAENWELYFEGENGEKIWKYKNEMTDCPAIVGSNNNLIAKRDMVYWDENGFKVYEDITQDYDFTKHLKNGELFVELPYEKSEVPDSIFVLRYDDRLGMNTYLTGPLYVRLDEGNPGELYENLEFLAAYAFSNGLSEYTTIDNLEFGYSNGTLCLGGFADGDSVDHITCQNSVISWCGGKINYFGESPMTTQYGYAHIDGGGFNTNGSYETIRNCYAHHCFQEGIGLETFAEDTETCEAVTIEDNVVEYCVMGLLVINWDEQRREDHLLKDISLKNNYVMYSGFENYYNFPVMLPPTEEGADWNWGAAIGKLTTDAKGGAGFGPDAHDGGYVSSGNTFAFASSNLYRVDFYYEEYMDYLTENTYAQLPGFSWFEIYNYDNGGPGHLETRRRFLNAEEAVKWLQDENATLITFD